LNPPARNRSDRTSTSKVEAEYPLGHKRRRAECFPALEKKFMAALSTRMPPTRAGFVFERTRDPQRFDATAVPDFVELFHPSPSPFLLPPIRGGLDYVVPAGEGALALPPGGAGGGGKKGGGGGAGGNFGGGDAFEYASTDRGDDTDRTGAPAIGY
jgi:2-methylcitrate dehydratase